MIAFVLSGGGSRGALQVGALQALLAFGIRPDLLVGTSAGALNAALIASNPTLEGVQSLAGIWKQVTQRDVYPGNHLQTLWRLICRCQSLYSNSAFQRMLRRHLRQAKLERFGDLASGARLFIVATNLTLGQEHVFGDRPADSLFDALMASTALPPLHPPWRCDGADYVDGAFSADLPVRIAIERGAKEIYGLHITRPALTAPTPQGAFDITFGAVGASLMKQTQVQLQFAASLPNVKVHYIPFTAFSDIPAWDFGHAAAMMQAGRLEMQSYLDKLTPTRRPINHRWAEVAVSSPGLD